MKDLEHIYYFEHLLEDANNELVRLASKNNTKIIGTTCSQVPEALLNLDGICGVRLRAPRTSSLEMGTYYLTSLLCEFSRALLERAIEGGYQFLDGIITPDGCTMMNRCVENMELLKINDKKEFFYRYMEVPMKCDKNGLNLYISQCREKILNTLNEIYNVDISDKALKKSVEIHNKVCNLIYEIGKYRKLDNPPITGHELHIINLATQVVPKHLIIDKLEETLKEIQSRKPDEKFKFRARVCVVGSEVDDIDFTRIIEESGAYVCADRFCFGTLPDRLPIKLKSDNNILEQVCSHYINNCMCPRYMDTPKMNYRREYVNDICKRYKADGIIYQQMKFCDPWGYERMVGSHVMRDVYNYPVLTIDRPYVVGNSGQLRTRVQAFVESIEIKKLQRGK